MAQVGRISGPLLKSNLERNGIDLAFKDVSSSTPTLFLDVNNNRIGVNTQSPIAELQIDSLIKPTDTYSLQRKLQSPGFGTDLYAESVSIDGDTAVVGAYYEDVYVPSYKANAGVVWVYTRNGSTWSEQTHFTASTPVANEYWGERVLLKGDALFVGQPKKDVSGLPVQTGAVTVLERTGSSWNEQQELAPADLTLGDDFGWSMAIDGNTLIIGAPMQNTRTGAAYVFTKSGSTWSLQQKLLASNAGVYDYFGVSVDIAGDTAVIAASGEDTSVSGSGAVYVFERNGSTWTEKQLFKQDNPSNNDTTRKVAISGNIIVASSWHPDNFAGSAYVFTKSGGTYTQTQELKPNDTAAGQNFGSTLQFDGETLVIGADSNIYGSFSQTAGSAYVFKNINGTWTQTQKITASDGAIGDEFGNSISLSGNDIMIGAERHNSARGAAYIFTNLGYAPVLNTTQAIIDNTAQFQNWTISPNGISISSGDIDIKSNAILTGFGTGTNTEQFLAARDNNIGSVNNNNIVLDPAGTGTVEFQSNTVVDGNMFATGNIRADGNLTLGSGDEDDILLKADIAVDIVPDATNTFKIGKPGKQFDEFYGSDITMDLLNGVAIQASGSSTPQPGSSTVQNLGLDIGNTFFVARNGDDTDGGFHPAAPFLTLKRALDAADSSTQGPVTIRIAPGTYNEIVPLVIPSHVSIIGEDMRNVIISPATGYESNDIFLLEDNTTIMNLTIKDFFYDSVNDKGYGFKFNSQAKISTRSPYIQNVTVITQGTPVTVTASSTFSVNAQETNPRGITFNNDGTKMFIVGTTGDDVNEYTVSTGFDLSSTVTFVDSYTVTECPNPTAVKFNADGTKMFVTGVGNSNVHEYALSPGFDVSTASFTQTKVITVDNDMFGLDFKPDGTKMYLTGNQNDKIYEFNLSSAFDISTASFVHDKYLFDIDDEPFGIEFNSDGTRIFVVGTKGNGVDEYTLSTPYDISTMTHMGFFFIGGNPSGIHINPAGTKMFIVGNQSDLVKSYDLSTSYRVSQDNDPRGFDSGNAGRGALVDGATLDVDTDATQASMLFHSVTFITPGADALTCKNGVRVEWLNCFTYFANIGIHCLNGTGRTTPDSATKTGAELRSIASANVYGNIGIKGDGNNVLIYAINHNLAYIGTGKFVDNDPSRAVQAQEVVKANSANVYFTSQDHTGDFRVGDQFFIDLESGTTSLDLTQADFGNLNSLQINTGGSTTEITPTSINTGDFLLSGNTIKTTSNNFVLDSQGTGNNIRFLGNVRMPTLDLSADLIINGDLFHQIGQIPSSTTLDTNANSLIPYATNTYNLGGSFSNWKSFHTSEMNIGNINFIDNKITNYVTDDNLNFSANGTGKVYIPSDDLDVTGGLVAGGTSTFTTGLQINGNLTANVGSTLNFQSGYSASKFTAGTLRVDNAGIFEDIKIDGTEITTTNSNSNLDLNASGTGDIQFYNLTLQSNISITGDLTFANNNFTRVTAQFDSGNIKIYDNVIETTESNSDLELRSYTGRVKAEDINFQNSMTIGSDATDITLASDNVNISGSTTGIKLPVGTTAQQDNILGGLRYNTTENLFEGYISGWTGFNGVYSDNKNEAVLAHPTNNTLIIKAGGVNQGIFDSTKLTINGLQADEVLANNNEIASINSNSDLELEASGNGYIFVDNIEFQRSKIITTTTNDNLNLNSAGDGYWKFGGTTGVVIPVIDDSGTEPGVQGQLRWNSLFGKLEVWTGSLWENSAGFIETVPQNDAEDINFEQSLIFG